MGRASSGVSCQAMKKAPFPTTWGVDLARFIFTPFQHSLRGGNQDRSVTAGGYVFAGGS